MPRAGDRGRTSGAALQPRQQRLRRGRDRSTSGDRSSGAASLGLSGRAVLLGGPRPRLLQRGGGRPRSSERGGGEKRRGLRRRQWSKPCSTAFQSHDGLGAGRYRAVLGRVEERWGTPPTLDSRPSAIYFPSQQPFQSGQEEGSIREAEVRFFFFLKKEKKLLSQNGEIFFLFSHLQMGIIMPNPLTYCEN